MVEGLLARDLHFTDEIDLAHEENIRKADKGIRRREILMRDC